MDLEKIGWSEWFQQQTEPEKLEQYRLARVVTVNKENYQIRGASDELTYAEVTGKFYYNASSALDYPAVGDWVYAQFFDDDSQAIIHELLPRKTLLKRKTAGKKVDIQLIAANIDIAFILQSLDDNFNLRRLERYLVMIHESEIRPVVLLSKSDLLPAEELQEKIAEINAISPDLTILPFSNINRDGLENIVNLLNPGETFCLLGSSGVGKTTLLNNLLGKETFDTRQVREKDSRGRHTTTRRQLILLENGALVVDTPGMRELGNFDISTGLEVTFDEISELTNQCRFNDCTHIKEKGCAVLAALDEGAISPERYENFMKMTREAAHYERSYIEKRQRDKAFGKMIKSIMKDNKKK